LISLSLSLSLSLYIYLHIYIYLCIAHHALLIEQHIERLEVAVPDAHGGVEEGHAVDDAAQDRGEERGGQRRQRAARAEAAPGVDQSAGQGHGTDE